MGENERLDDKFRDLRVLLKEDMTELRNDLISRVEGVHERLDTLNGRTGKSEIAIAVLQDRSERSERTAEAARQAAATSSVEASIARAQASSRGRIAGAIGSFAGAAAAAFAYVLWKIFG